MGKSQQLSYSKKKKNYPLWFKLSLATTSHKQPSVWVVASLMEGTVYNERERRLVPFICLVRLRWLNTSLDRSFLGVCKDEN